MRYSIITIPYFFPKNNLQMPDSFPLIVTGMHRSGTSMIAGYLANTGLFLGDKLLQAGKHNPHGYFEDKDLVEFHGRVLTACTNSGNKGWLDWGYTEDLKFDKTILSSFKDEAEGLISKKLKSGVAGWKDPRTTLILDFWIELIPEAKVLGIYRNPWEVKQSIKKLNAAVFNENPTYPYEIWNWYNTHLIKFAESNPDKCILISSNAFIQNPKQVCTLLEKKWNLKFDTKQVEDYSFFDSNLFSIVNDFSDYEEFFKHAEFVSTIDRLNTLSSLIADYKNTDAECNMKLSVVIPCYNQGEYIIDALNSISASRNKVGEIIVVNDGSTDEKTISILDRIDYPNTIIIHQENRGLANARNQGYKKSAGEYILFLDADNKVDPKYITTAVDILNSNKETAVVYSNPRFFGSSSLMRKLDDFDIAKILSQNYIDACTIIRKSALEEVGGFDENMPLTGYEDWELWINLFRHGWKFHHVNEFLFDYRVKDHSMVSNTNLPDNRKKNTKYLCDKHCEVYTENFQELLPLIMENYANVENIAIERQKVIDNFDNTTEQLKKHNSLLTEELDQLKYKSAVFYFLKKLKNIFN